MNYYCSLDKDCRETTPDLVEAKKPFRFEKHKAEKKSRGRLPSGHLDRTCDGYALSYRRMCNRSYGGYDTGFFMLAAGMGVVFLIVLISGDIKGIIPWSDHPDAIGGSLVYWGITIPFLTLAIFFRYLAKKDGFENIVFHRRYGTVTFAESPGYKRLTVPFEAVELGIFNINHIGVGTRSWAVVLRSTLKPKGDKRAREVLFPLGGVVHQDFQNEWNMICRFMDKSMSYPDCLRAIIDGYNNNISEDIWGNPMPKEKQLTRRKIGLPEDFDSPFKHYT